MELTGSPRIEREEGILYGDTMIWDRALNQIRATNQRMGPRRGDRESPSTNDAPDAVTVPVRTPAETNTEAAAGTPADE